MVNSEPEKDGTGLELTGWPETLTYTEARQALERAGEARKGEMPENLRRAGILIEAARAKAGEKGEPPFGTEGGGILVYEGIVRENGMRVRVDFGRDDPDTVRAQGTTGKVIRAGAHVQPDDGRWEARVLEQDKKG